MPSFRLRSENTRNLYTILLFAYNTYLPRANEIIDNPRLANEVDANLLETHLMMQQYQRVDVNDPNENIDQSDIITLQNYVNNIFAIIGNNRI